jgi:hypothetical protein
VLFEMEVLFSNSQSTFPTNLNVQPPTTLLIHLNRTSHDFLNVRLILSQRVLVIL